jgi:GWxTD domain-containing protein
LRVWWFLAAVFLFAPTIVAARPSTPAVPIDSLARAATMIKWAREALTDSSIEARSRAVRDLNQAIRLDPRNPEPWLLLGRANEMGAYREEARACYRNAIARAPDSPDGYFELGLAWKREWLRTLNEQALEHAAQELDTVTTLRPHGGDAWLHLVPLRMERGDLAGAAAAAERALDGRPRRAETPLAAAYISFRRGDTGRADSLFRVAIPRLDPSLRAFFDRPSWIGLGKPASASNGKPVDSWAGLDPDPTTPENEVQLEYWSRVAHAYFVFFDPLKATLDARAEIYVRYGPPRSVEMNPLGTPNTFQTFHASGGKHTNVWDWPLDAQVWSYPELGMRIVLHDQSLNGNFTQPAAREPDPKALPDPRLMAARGDLSLAGGHAVFPTLPPREQRLDVRGIVAHFEGERRPRLLVQVQAPGSPSDTLWARAVVLDTTGQEIAHQSRLLSTSACNPAEQRFMEFTAELPPGAFQIAVSVRDEHLKRGLYRSPVTLAPPSGALALSDIVLSCGDPSSMVSGSSIRLEANVDARVVRNRPVSAYFEIYRLAAGSDGQAHFEYEYQVRRIPEELTGIKRLFVKPEAPIMSSVSREAANVGALRRQFVTVPIQSLPEGRYELEIKVRDLVSGAVADGTTRFVKE